MMGVTHVFMGIMSAVIMTQPETVGGCLSAVAGGALGGIVCDIDLNKKPLADTAAAWKLTAALVLACLAVDLYLDAGLIRSVRRADTNTLLAGFMGILLLYLWGKLQPHRGGTHSLLAVVLSGMCMKLVCPMLGEALVVGMLSHLVLDLLNNKPLRLLYPLQGKFCLGLCSADGRLNSWLRRFCLLGSILLLGISIGRLYR